MRKYIEKALMLYALAQNPMMFRFMNIDDVRAIYEDDKE